MLRGSPKILKRVGTIKLFKLLELNQKPNLKSEHKLHIYKANWQATNSN